MRGSRMDASVYQVSVIGFQISAASVPECELWSMIVDPPTARTVPSGSISRLCW
jgi:hypothetical protein